MAMLKLLKTIEEEYLFACSWCNKIRIGDGSWEEIENALPGYSANEIQAMTRVSYGICSDCYDQVMPVL